MAKKRNNKEQSSYWQERAIEREALWNQKSRATIEKELTEQYRKAALAIQDNIAVLYGRYASENGLTLKEARALLTGSEFREWRMSLEEYTALSATNNAVLKELNTLAMRPRISRLEKLRGDVLKELYKLGDATTKSVTAFLGEAYKDNYYKSLYEVGRTAGIQGAISVVDNKALENVLRNPWSGKNYSERIWTNQKKLADTLQETMSAGLHRGLSVPKLSKMVQERMGVGAHEATRLVRTELNYVHNQANLDSLKEGGFKYYKFVATLDKRTSSMCRNRDGEIIPIEDAAAGSSLPPLHPHCRSTIIGSLGEGKGGQKGTRAARVGDGKTFYVPQQMTYSDYKAVYVDKTKSFASWAKETRFKGIKSRPVPAVETKKEQPTIQFTNMDSENWDKTKTLLGDLSSEYKTKLKTVEYKVDKGAGPGEVDITSSAMRLSSRLDSVVVHEFAHTLAVERADKLGISDNHLFWNEIRKIRTAYKKARAKNPNISISAYADSPGKNYLDEFMAEAFAHAKCAEKGIKVSGYGTDYTYSNKVLETIDKYFKQEVKYTSKVSSHGAGGDGIIDLKKQIGSKAQNSIPDDEYNLTIRRQVQNRHIVGTAEHKRYVEKLKELEIEPSVFYEDVDIQYLVETYHKKGIYDPAHDGSTREYVNVGRYIGKYWDLDADRLIDTTFIKIIYSKKGVHAYPIRPK